MRLIIVFLLIFFCSCARKRFIDSDNSNQVLVIDILPETGSKLTKLSEFAEKYGWVYADDQKKFVKKTGGAI